MATVRFIALLISFVLLGCEYQVQSSGHDGEKGDKGEPGVNGINGTDGAIGPKGDRGEPGKSGQSGEDGEDGLTGPQGEKGQSGEDGEDGTDGRDGENFKSCPIDFQCPDGYTCNPQGICLPDQDEKDECRPYLLDNKIITSWSDVYPEDMLVDNTNNHLTTQGAFSVKDDCGEGYFVTGFELRLKSIFISVPSMTVEVQIENETRTSVCTYWEDHLEYSCKVTGFRNAWVNPHGEDLEYWVTITGAPVIPMGNPSDRVYIVLNTIDVGTNVAGEFHVNAESDLVWVTEE